MLYQATEHDPGKYFSSNREQGNSSAVSTVGFVTFPLEDGDDCSILPFLGDGFRGPDVVDQLVEPTGEEIATML